MVSLARSVEITGKPVHDYLFDQAVDVPLVDRAAAQGDVLIASVQVPPTTTPMPRTVVVVASEASSNTHTLHPNGACFYEPHAADEATDLILGVLTVPEGSTALLSHQEHGNLEIAPGTYEVRRQREFAGEWNYVRD